MAIRIPIQIIKRLQLEEGAEFEVVVTPQQDILLHPVHKHQDTNEELRIHLQTLLAKIKPDSPRHEEIDFGQQGDELL